MTYRLTRLTSAARQSTCWLGSDEPLPRGTVILRDDDLDTQWTVQSVGQQEVTDPRPPHFMVAAVIEVGTDARSA